MMALWHVKSPIAAAHGFEAVKPIEVLDALDVPLTFTFRDRDGVLLLANLCAVGVHTSRYVVFKTSDFTVSDLKNGLIPLRSAMVRSPLWLMDVQPDGRVIHVWNVSLNDLPAEAIPESGALLTAELEAEQLADEELARFAKSDSDAQIAFDGGPVKTHEIDAGFFGEFVQLASRLFADICVSIEAPPPILRLGMTSESSYAVELKVEERSPEELGDGSFSKLFYEQQGKPPDLSRLRHAFDVLMSLVMDPQPNAEALTLVKRSYPLRQRYGRVLELIATEGATVAARTRTKPRLRTVSGMQAGERLRAVRDLGYPYMFLELRGALIGGLTHKSGRTEPFFTIRVEIGKKVQDFSGTVPDQIVDQIRRVALDAEVWARLQIREEAKEQGYALVEIKEVSDQSPHNIK
ncbi:MAG TPA: hypothetical protein VFC78_20330 [Tepidisphaeraceae bacterium]|nr:hypothetical protein [Tepidisphaeraceae bacterium]